MLFNPVPRYKLLETANYWIVGNFARQRRLAEFLWKAQQYRED